MYMLKLKKKITVVPMDIQFYVFNEVSNPPVSFYQSVRVIVGMNLLQYGLRCSDIESCYISVLLCPFQGHR